MYKNLKNEFKKVLEYSQIELDSISDEAIDLIFDKWAKNKANFIKAWGGTEIELSIPVSLEMTQEDKEERMRDFISDMVIFTPEIYKQACADFLSKIDVNSFFDNRVSFNYINPDLEIKVPQGAKLSKSLKVFFSENSVFTLTRMQSVISRIIQDNKIHGKIVLSVNPLDFLSISENTNNWRSCQALDGEYRAGVVSQMMDKHTFVAYLKSDKEVELPNFPEESKWNNKKWRTLYYWDKDQEILVGAKQYPFTHNLLQQTVVSFIHSTLGLDYEDFEGDKTESRARIKEVMEDERFSMHFNDCLVSSDKNYEPLLQFGQTEVKERMVIGAETPCLKCGDYNITLASTFVCESCGGHIQCECCGIIGHLDDMYVLEGEYLCCGCWEDAVIYCDSCGDTYNAYATNLNFMEDTNEFFCDYCYEENNIEEISTED